MPTSTRRPAPIEDAAHREWEAWQVVCAALREARAVTEADMESVTTSPLTTPGLKLLHAIRAWGKTKPALEEENLARNGW